MKLFQMPEDVDANELRDWFAKEGEVVFLNLYEDSRDGGIVKFKPPHTGHFGNIITTQSDWMMDVHFTRE